MFKKFAFLALLTAWFVTGSATENKLTGNTLGESDIPAICAACNFLCEISVATVDSTYRGRDTLAVPISIKVESGQTINHVWIKLTMDNGLDYLDLHDNESGGNIDADASSGTDIDFQLTNCNIEGDGAYHHLIDLRVSISDTVSFANFKGIHFQANSPVVRGSGSQTFCDAAKVNGGINIVSDWVQFDIHDTTGYSWQAMDGDDPEKLDYITVPVTFRASFPIDRFRIGISSGDSLETETYFYDFLPNPEYAVQIDWSEGGRFLFDTETLYPVDTTVILGYMRYRGPNYLESYTDPSFSASEEIHFHDDLVQSEVESYISNHILYFNSFDISSGHVNFPVYSCTTSISSGIIGHDSLVIVPVIANHTFFSQTYRYFISYDSTLLTLADITVPTGQQEVNFDQNEGHNGVRKICWIETHPLIQNGLYVGANINTTIFNLVFRATDKFTLSAHDSTSIEFDTSIDHCYVRDYYHPSPDKIERTSHQSGQFVFNSGYVKMPWVFEVSIDTVDCEADENGVVWVPLRLDNVLLYNGDHMRFHLICPDIQFDSFKGDSSDFSYKDVYYHQVNDSVINVILTYSNNAVNSPGLIGHICCKPTESSGFSHLRTDSWTIVRYPYEYNPPWLGTIDEMPTVNIEGGINACDCKKDLRLADQPERYKLAPNYPNPFNSSTVISFSLQEAGSVSLDVMDLLGRKVKGLASGKFETGEHSVIWNGRNECGEEVTAGVYFYVLRTDSFQMSKKMVFLK